MKLKFYAAMPIDKYTSTHLSNILKQGFHYSPSAVMVKPCVCKKHAVQLMKLSDHCMGGSEKFWFYWRTKKYQAGVH